VLVSDGQSRLKDGAPIDIVKAGAADNLADAAGDSK
jgi:hypothetical protein